MSMDHPAGKQTLSGTAEARRLAESRQGVPWRRWGPYLSERQWGTVREDYSADGDAWAYFPHDHARSRAYRWGEDGIAGFGDDQLNLCLGLALWNERDPILKERLFGLTNSEGNHGEDVKELYYYLDATPSHSWMRMLYKYPQAAFPYARLVEENRRRSTNDPEFELLDTGLFDGDRYFDVEITYAKGAPDDILMEIVATNRGPDPAPLHILPQLWARNTWSWKPGVAKPMLRRIASGEIVARRPRLPAMRLVCDGAPELLFCENETNSERLWGQKAAGYFKDGINDHVVGGDGAAVNPAGFGTKAASHYKLLIPGGASARLAALVSRWNDPNSEERHLLSLLRGHRVKRLLARMLDESEFLSEYGIRAVSKRHEHEPFVFEHQGDRFSVGYVPGESLNNAFGGNSNWRGPIWMPVNYLLIESLRRFHRYYGDEFTVECPTGSGRMMTLDEVARELSRRLSLLFLKDDSGRRPVFGDSERHRNDPAFRDHVLFYEYFHGDTGRGIGASHQTGWTGLVALLLADLARDAAQAGDRHEIAVAAE